MLELNIYDFNTILVCVAIGYLLKYYPLFKGISNKLIPIILSFGCGIIYSLSHGTAYFGTGLLLGIIAVGSYDLINKLIQYINKRIESKLNDLG